MRSGQMSIYFVLRKFESIDVAKVRSTVARNVVTAKHLLPEYGEQKLLEQP